MNIIENHIQFRYANIHDLPLLQHWDKQPHNIASDPNDDWNWEEELPRYPTWRKQLIAELKGRPIGFVQIIDPLQEETKYWGDVPANMRAIDIWIGEASDLGKGYGTIMMQLVIDICFSEQDVTAIIIDPIETNARAIKFYESLGFRFLEKRTFGEDVCAVYKLLKSDWNKTNM